MEIQDLIIEQDDRVEENLSSESTHESTRTDLGEVEKVASLLDAASEEDTLMDEIAKLAVLNDFFIENGVTKDHLEKVAFNMKPISAWWDDVVKAQKERSKVRSAAKADKRQAKKNLKDAKRQRRVSEIEAEAAEARLETSKNLRAAKSNRKAAEDDSSTMSGALPFVAGGALGAVGGGLATKAYQDKKKEKEMREIAEKYFYAGADAASKGGA